MLIFKEGNEGIIVLENKREVEKMSEVARLYVETSTEDDREEEFISETIDLAEEVKEVLEK